MKMHQFYMNGVISAEYYIDSNGKRQGQWKNYMDNGNPFIICNYKDDKLEGTTVYYDAKLDVQKILGYTNYRSGRQFGLCL